MKTKILLVVVIFSILTVIALSQLQSNSVSSEEKQQCTTIYYDETEPVYDYVTRTRDTFGVCFNPANSSNYPCVNGTENYQSYEITDYQTVTKSRSECRPKSFEITINKGIRTEKKEIDFSGWGVCIQENEGDCIAVLCGTLEGGSARNGIFNGCDGGKQCKKFLFCDDEVKVLVKGSQPGFVEESATWNRITKRMPRPVHWRRK